MQRAFFPPRFLQCQVLQLYRRTEADSVFSCYRVGGGGVLSGRGDKSLGAQTRLSGLFHIINDRGLDLSRNFSRSLWTEVINKLS